MSTSASTTASGPARLGVNFTLLWSGEAVSLMGTATTSVLLPLLAVTHLHAGPGWMGLLTASAWLPWLLIGMPAGAWLDRLDPRAVMIAADLVAAATLASVPLGWWLGFLSLPQLLVVALLGGTATVFFRPAYVKLLPLIVSDQQLEAANARLFGTESAAQVAGPGLAGLLAQLASAAAGLVVDVVGFCVSAVCLWRIRPHDAHQPDPEAAEPLRARIAEGVRVVVQDRNLRVLTVIGGASNLGLTGYASLLVLYLVRDLQLSPATLGVVMMVGSAGGLLGALIAPALSRRFGTGRSSTVLLLLAGPSALLVALPRDAAHAYLSSIGLLLVGAGVVGGNVVRATWRQRYVPAHLLARVLTTMQVVSYGTIPLAGLAAGALGTTLGVRPTMILLAGVHALACVSVLLTAFGRKRVLPPNQYWVNPPVGA